MKTQSNRCSILLCAFVLAVAGTNLLANTLVIRLWNFTGYDAGQWGSRLHTNVMTVAEPGGDPIPRSGPPIGGYIFYIFSGAMGGPKTGVYTAVHRCTWDFHPSRTVARGYFQYNADDPSTTYWDWFVFGDGCIYCNSVSSGITDGNDGVPNGSNSSSPSCTGMARWSVSEPYISVWLRDEPLGYSPALGPRVAFQLSYSQREDSAGMDPNTFSVGKKWNCSWLSYVSQDANGSNVVSFAGGGHRTFGGTSDYLTRTSLSGTTNTGFTLNYPDGSKDVFGFIVTNSAGVFSNAFLTERWSPQGHAVRLNYDAYDPATPVVRLLSVVDGDGRTNRIYYNPTNSYSTNLISRVVDPYERACVLDYDSDGTLLRITDPAGITSSFLYAPNAWITNLTTPYGSTSFAITDTAGGDTVPNGRSVLVTEPDGSHQLFIYKDSAPGVPASYSAAEVPDTSPYINSLDVTDLHLRNTFHWGPRQYASLSTNSIGAFTAADFQKARMQHWLLAATNGVSESLSLAREPSPDTGGLVAGQITWYDYSGKPNFSAASTTQSLPLIVARVLPNGSTSYTYTPRNSLGFPTSETSTYGPGSPPLLRTSTFLYAANGIDLLAVTNALGVRVASNSYNAFHQVTTNYNARGEPTAYTYNDKQQLTSVTTPSGLITTNIYLTSGDASSRLDRAIDYAIISGSPVYYRTNAYTWANGLVRTHTDPRGLTVTNTWDDLQRLRRVDFPGDPPTFVTNVYDKLDLVRVIDRMGFTNSFGYNAVRHLTDATNANGTVTHYEFCACGALESLTEALGTTCERTTYYDWDLQGNLLSTRGPDGYNVTNFYNALGQPTTSTDGLTSVTNWYNNQGLQVASFNAAGQVSAAIFDALDRATNTTDANGVTVTNVFDDLDRLLSKGYPDGGVERFGYTFGVAGPTSVTNQLGSNVLNIVYDPLGRTLAEITPGVTTNTFTYFPAGDRRTLTDGKNQTTTWNRDEYGQATNKLDATGAEIFRWTFDANGRLHTRWTPAKGTTSYTFDRAGNLTFIDHPVSPDITLQYDPLNRLTNMVDALGTTKYTYTTAGLLETEDGPWADDTVTYSHQNRLRTGLTLQQPNASPWAQSYGYDAARRMTNTTSPAGAFTYQFGGTSSASSLIKSLLLPNGAAITNSFDSVARLTSTYLRNSSGLLLNSHEYVINTASQRMRQTRTHGDFVDYTYDNASQLLTALGKEPGGTTNRLNEQLRYVYDPAGNLNWRTNNALAQQFSVNNLNELTTVNRTGDSTLTVAGTTTSPATGVTVNDQPAALYADSTFAREGFSLVDGTNTFTAIAQDSYGRSDTNSSTAYLPASVSLVYDLNGNLRTNGNQVVGYDDENQLTSITVSNSWRSEFVYDGKMRCRVRKEFTWLSAIGDWRLASELHLVYDGNVPLQHRDANNLPALTLTRGLDLSGTLQGAGGIGGLLAMTEPSGAHSYYHSDAGGNITCLVNGAQVVAAQAGYDPYGGFLFCTGPGAALNPFWFSSKPLHPQSGYYDFLYRWYAPDLQRWANRDPISEADGLNLYSYVRNCPAARTDPTGRNAYLLNYDGGAGHTYLVVDNPQGGVVVAEFWASSWGEAPSLHSGLLALTLDVGTLRIRREQSIKSILDAIAGKNTTDPSPVEVRGIAIGTSADDTLLIDHLYEQKNTLMFYSLLGQQQCHSLAERWFYNYVRDGTSTDRFNFSDIPRNVHLPPRIWLTRSYLADSSPFSK